MQGASQGQKLNRRNGWTAETEQHWRKSADELARFAHIQSDGRWRRIRGDAEQIFGKRSLQLRPTNLEDDVSWQGNTSSAAPLENVIWNCAGDERVVQFECDTLEAPRVEHARWKRAIQQICTSIEDELYVWRRRVAGGSIEEQIRRNISDQLIARQNNGAGRTTRTESKDDGNEPLKPLRVTLKVNALTVKSGCKSAASSSPTNELFDALNVILVR